MVVSESIIRGPPPTGPSYKSLENNIIIVVLLKDKSALLHVLYIVTYFKRIRDEYDSIATTFTVFSKVQYVSKSV